MAKDLFKRYIWLVDTIYRAEGITFKEINERWLKSSMSNGEKIPLKTFHNHRKEIEDIFDINIECDKRDGYKYYIDNSDDIRKSGMRTWLLNTFAVDNLIKESLHLRKRILFEHIPSGQKFLTSIIEAMRDNLTIEITYQSFWKDSSYTRLVEPYFVKIFRQRWYMVARDTVQDAIRVYALDRIHELHTTDISFDMPDSFNPEEFFYHSFGIIRDDNYPPEIIELKVYDSKRRYFRSLPLHHSQEEIVNEKDFSIFRYYLSPTYDFKQEILSHGYEVEVISPDSLKGEIRWIAETIASR